MNVGGLQSSAICATVRGMNASESAQIARLARMLGVEVTTPSRGRSCWWIPAARRIVIGPDCPFPYIGALHELGHAATGACEANAWTWARGYSLRPWTRDENAEVSRCLATYSIRGKDYR